MADVDSKMRSVHTSSRTRILWGIGIAIVGGMRMPCSYSLLLQCLTTERIALLTSSRAPHHMKRALLRPFQLFLHVDVALNRHLVDR